MLANVTNATAPAKKTTAGTAVNELYVKVGVREITYNEREREVGSGKSGCLTTLLKRHPKLNFSAEM